MYKVLITDDEPMIREGLRTLIDWEQHGFQVVDTAANGRDAIQKYNLYNPDLMIVDIRMPGMSGLELIETLRQDGGQQHVLILSGYADFDYAKKAINLRIDGYLLKPIDEEELISYLKDMKLVLDGETEAKQRTTAIDIWSREMVIQSLLKQGHKDAALYNKEEAAKAGLDWDSYEILLIKLQSSEIEIEPSQLALLKDGLYRVFDENERGAVFSLEPNMGLLLKGNLDNEQVRKSIYKEIVSLINNNQATEKEIEVIIAAGGGFQQLSDIHLSNEKAAQLLSQRFFYEGGQIITEHLTPVGQPLQGERETNLSADLGPISEKLYYAIDIGNREAIAQLIMETGRKLLEAGLSEQRLKSQFADLVSWIMNRMLLNDANMQGMSPTFSADIMDIYKQSSYKTLELYLVGLLSGFIQESSHGGTDKQIKKMIDLINRNYFENLKLETLADVFNYNSAYLGKLFKNVTGEYFNTYVDKVRIEKAKQLLDQGMKVYQVAEKVGYTNVDYFHSKFRKYVGTSPSAHRKK